MLGEDGVAWLVFGRGAGVVGELTRGVCGVMGRQLRSAMGCTYGE